jgi:L-Lysine epsilon oxidase N-terminal
MAITEVRIHPAIGIARVGNSTSDFFIGAESVGTARRRRRPQATAVPVADELRRLVDQLQQALRSHR